MSLDEFCELGRRVGRGWVERKEKLGGDGLGRVEWGKHVCGGAGDELQSAWSSDVRDDTYTHQSS